MPRALPHMTVRNDGDIEARRVYIGPLRFGAGRKIVFHKVDVLPASNQLESRRDVRLTCYGVDWQKTNIPDFLFEGYSEDSRAIVLPQPDAPATFQTGQVIKRRVYSAMGMADATMDMRMTYYDNHCRRYSATFRLKFRILGYHTVSARVELLSDGEPVRPREITGRGGAPAHG
jgi:hypothetical protein